MKLILLLGILAGATADAWTLVGPAIAGWERRDLEFQYNLADCPIPQEDLIPLLLESIDAWNASQSSNLVLTLADAPVSTSLAQLLAGTAPVTPLFIWDTGFTANQSSDGDAIPAITRVATSGGRLAYAGIVLNAEPGKLSEISMMPVEALTIAIAHEIGHALGLGHSSNVKALMYYSVGEKTSMQLAQDDMDGLSYLYPRDELSGGPFGCASARRGARPRADLGWLLVLLLIPIWWGRRMASRSLGR